MVDLTRASLVEQGSTVLGLAALDEEADPDNDRELAGQLADAAAHVGAMTPARPAEFVAETAGMSQPGSHGTGSHGTGSHGRSR
ncbi:VWA domain-containing protein [Streptomyces finlayi]|uniref:VWA domain-containing protein n=1 Tax=Streptomyces finlayi TaxID=67296 RepID=UPI0021561BE9|nr:VWA domain-containing protein [Streptomyces finlayi]